MKPNITLKPVTSSQICAVGHCPIENVLHVQFFKKGDDGKRVGGNIYSYDKFTADDFAAFQRAESMGTHFGKFIKDAKHDDGSLKFPFTKLEMDPAAGTPD